MLEWVEVDLEGFAFKGIAAVDVWYAALAARWIMNHLGGRNDPTMLATTGLQLGDDTIFGGSHGRTGAGWSAVGNICGRMQRLSRSRHDIWKLGFGDRSRRHGVGACLEPSYGAALLVDPGNHQDSVLWAKVEDNGEYGAVMPTAGKMGQANVDIIRDWIDDIVRW